MRNKQGRQTEYTPELGERICELITCRVSLDRICEMPEMPSVGTIYKWLRAVPSFNEAYSRARELRADARADCIDELHDKLARGEIDPTTARVLFDMERWQASKEKPGRYGDSIKTEVSGKDGGPIQVENKLSDFELARKISAILATTNEEPKTINGEYTALLEFAKDE